MGIYDIAILALIFFGFLGLIAFVARWARAGDR